MAVTLLAASTGETLVVFMHLHVRCTHLESKHMIWYVVDAKQRQMKPL